jgi:hypothetical protein
MDLNLWNICIFGEGTYAVAVAFQPVYACIATLSGDNIYLSFNYSLTEANYCRGITVLNDFDCYIACVGGVFRYRISA